MSRTVPAFTSRLLSAVLIGLALLAASDASAAPYVQTLVLSVGGESNGTAGCTQFSAPASVVSNFGAYGVFIPVGGLAPCNIAGGYDDVSSPTGPIADDRAFYGAWGLNALDGTASARADFGVMTARSRADFTGTSNSLTVAGSDAFGLFSETFTVTSPSVADGQPGTVRILVTVSGSLSVSGYGYAWAEVDYAVNAGSNTRLFLGWTNRDIVVPTLYTIGGVGQAGFTLAPGTLSGQGEIATFNIPIVFGTPFDFRIGLLAYALPVTTSLTRADFQAVVSGFEVNGPGGALADFAISAGSGTGYNAGGVTAAPDDIAGTPVVPRLAVFPNPGAAPLRFSAAVDGEARLEIFDIAGRRIRVVYDGPLHGDANALVWDGRTDAGLAAPPGLYFARLSGEGGVATARVALVR